MGAPAVMYTPLNYGLLEIMTYPVMTSSGFNFERSALSAWLNGKGNQADAP